jgi:hypothetical protein
MYEVGVYSAVRLDSPQALYVSELKHMLSGLHHFMDILADGYRRSSAPGSTHSGSR